MQSLFSNQTQLQTLTSEQQRTVLRKQEQNKTENHSRTLAQLQDEIMLRIASKVTKSIEQFKLDVLSLKTNPRHLISRETFALLQFTRIVPDRSKSFLESLIHQNSIHTYCNKEDKVFSEKQYEILEKINQAINKNLIKLSEEEFLACFQLKQIH